MLFVGDLNNRELSSSLGKALGVDVIYPEKHVFDDGEQRIRIEKEVLDADIYLLKSISDPVDNNLVEFLFTLDALKRSGASTVNAIVPYLGYSRADHIFRNGEAVGLEVVISCIEAGGLDEIIIIDPHTIKIPEMFQIKTKLLSALPAFAEKIKEMDLNTQKMSIVSPDMGGIRRVKQLSDLLPGSAYAAVNKDRDLSSGSIATTHVEEGEIRDICIVTDDIISTGGTMANAVELCKKEGAKEIYVFATQPVFSNDAHTKLKECSADKVFVADAITVPKENRFEKLETISLAPLIAKALKP